MAHKKLRIGIVLSAVPPYSETFFTTKINGLTKAGFSVYLFAPGRWNPELDCQWIRPYPVFRFSLFRIVALILVLPLAVVRAQRPVFRFWKSERQSGASALDAIKRLYLNAHILPHSLDWLHFGFAAVAVRREEVARAIGARMAVSFRGYDLNVYPLKHPGCYNKLWERVDQVHSISRYLLEKAFVLGLSPDKPYRIITPAVNIGPDRVVKTELDLNNPVRILTVARLTWIKGLEHGIRAVGILKSLNVAVHYTIIGDGPEHEKLLHEIGNLDLAAEVSLVGKRSHAETLQSMAQSDVYIQPSLNEGFCNSVLEAQAVGCLCIASNAGGLPENIEDGKTGFLVEPGNARALADAIRSAIQLPLIKRKEFYQNGQKRILESFGIKFHLEQWVKFYTGE